MCGICGIIFHRSAKSGEHLIQKMNSAMVHRGPDGGGTFHDDGGVYLGHRRLSIIDHVGGAQPMKDEAGRYTVVFNGEIYNYQRIRQEMQEESPCKFLTNSDTEVLLSAYSRYGSECLSKFIGMFAFAIHDSRDGSLFIARDRLGIKPFYYVEKSDYFIFASEIKALFASGLVRPEVNLAALDYYLTLGYVPGQQTMFRGINKLLPGHYGIFKNGQFSEHRYWNISSSQTFTRSYREAQEDLGALLEDSIRLRLISDVPVGVFLSGGVDSSAVVATIVKKIGRNISTFSVGYSDDPTLSELSTAKAVAERFSTDHHEYILEHSDFFASIDDLLTYSEEPIVEAAAIALYQLSKVAQKHATVLLSGEGADEIFAGYPLYLISKKIETLRAGFPSWLTQKAAQFAAGHNEKFAKYCDWLSMSPAHRYKGISQDVTISIKTRMYTPELLATVGEVDQSFYSLFTALENGSDLKRMQYVDVNTWLPDDLLLKADKMTMAASIELRVPFLDHRLVEFGLSIPDSYKIVSGNAKYILKDYMRKYLPDHMIFQKKKGFPVPIARWFKGDLYNSISEILLDKKTSERGYISPAYVQRILKLHSKGKADMSRRLLSLLVLELWHRKYIDSTKVY